MSRRSDRKRNQQPGPATTPAPVSPSGQTAWTPFRSVELSPEPLFSPSPSDNAIEYVNSRYRVRRHDWANGEVLLSIYPLTGEIHDWRDFQRIKNELCGPAREACELYPAESRLVDTANVFHLTVLPEGECFPFGFQQRQVRGPEGSALPQRPFETDAVPVFTAENHEAVASSGEASHPESRQGKGSMTHGHR